MDCGSYSFGLPRMLCLPSSSGNKGPLSCGNLLYVVMVYGLCTYNLLKDRPRPGPCQTFSPSQLGSPLAQQD